MFERAFFFSSSFCFFFLFSFPLKKNRFFDGRIFGLIHTMRETHYTKSRKKKKKRGANKKKK